MLGTPRIEDYFVLSSIHDYPLQVTQLEACMDSLIILLEKSLKFIDDKKTKLSIKKEILNARESKENLGKDFFQEAKKKLGVPINTILWPEDFPTIRVLRSEETTVQRFDPDEVDFFLSKKTEAEHQLTHLCNEYNPILLIAIPTIQMQKSLVSTNPEFLKLFEGTWTGKKIDKSILEKIAENVAQKGLRKFEIEAMHESFRQVLLTTIDLQRALRERLYRYCAKGQGEKTLISEYIFLQLFECLYTIFCIDWIANMMREFNLPILVIEDERLSVFTPIMSKHDILPFNNELYERQRRLLYQYVSSKVTDEEKAPPFLFLVQTLSEFELEELSFLLSFLQKSERKMMFFPRKVANQLFGDTPGISEAIISEWIEGPKSPFVKVAWKGEEYCLTTHIILEDKFFRISWYAHKGKHVKIRGTKFEDFVIDVLQKQFPDALTFKNKFFVAAKNGQQRRYEIDRTFVTNDLFFLIECKNLLLIEDSADFGKLRSRLQELQRYGDYLEFKANLLKDNYEQLKTKIPNLSEYKCTKIIPIIISLYPDLISFHKVPFLSIYEFIRYISLCQKKEAHVPFFTDFSQIRFRFPSFKIERKPLQKLLIVNRGEPSM